MRILLLSITLAASAAALSQSKVDRAFTATGASCDQVTWSQSALAQYPRIAEACQEVLQRDGKYYVKFQGEVRRVADRGRQVTIDFEGGDRLTLTPPENLRIYINGRATPVSQLRPGDQLNFYVPQDQLAASFFAGEDVQTAQAQEVPIEPAPPERMAAADPQTETTSPPEDTELPRTAGTLPWLGVGGGALLALGLGLSIRRRTARTTEGETRSGQRAM